MHVYELGSDFDRFVSLHFLLDDDVGYAVDHFRGKAMREIWYPLEVEHLIESEKDRRLLAGDFPNFGGDPAFSRHAVECLRDILEPCGEILPLKCKDGEYYAYNVTNVIDVLNMKKSELKLFSDGGVMDIVHYVFHEKPLKNELIFKIPQRAGLVYVTDAFVQRISEEGLQGFRFPEIYPELNDPWAFFKDRRRRK